MIGDNNLKFASAKALGNIGTAYSDVVNLGVSRDVGVGGRSLEIDLRMTETQAGATSTTQFQLQTATDEAFTSPKVLEETEVMTVGDARLAVGAEPCRWRIASPTLQYLRIAAIVAVANTTAGKYSAIVVVDRQANRAYPAGYSMSGG